MQKFFYSPIQQLYYIVLWSAIVQYKKCEQMFTLVNLNLLWDKLTINFAFFLGTLACPQLMMFFIVFLTLGFNEAFILASRTVCGGTEYLLIHLLQSTFAGINWPWSWKWHGKIQWNLKNKIQTETSISISKADKIQHWLIYQIQSSIKKKN